MSDERPELTRLHDAMISSLKAAFPALDTVEAFTLERQKIDSPAVLFEAVQFQPGGRVSGGRLPVVIEFAAHCILSVCTPKVELEILNMALAVMKHIDGNDWGLSGIVERPTELSAFPGMFKPDENGFESWVVSWEQTVHIGDVWTPDDFLPTEVYVGEAPSIGAAHQDKYERVAE